MEWVAALIGVAFGLGAYTFQYAQGWAYLSDDPAACKNCHIMNEPFDSWVQSSHHGQATCNDCHTPHAFAPKWISKAENGFNHSVKFTLQNFAEPIRIRRSNAERLQENCVRCHGDMVHTVRALAAPVAGELTCTRCHLSVGHGLK